MIQDDNHSAISETMFLNKKSLWHSGMSFVVNGDVSVDEVLRHTKRVDEKS